MKLFVYGMRDFDEEKFFKQYTKELNVDWDYTRSFFSKETMDLAKGYDCISISTQVVDQETIDYLKSVGVKQIATRSIGYDHIDYQYAKKVGMKVSNVSYNPDCVAEFSIMLMLMAIRNAESILQRAIINDFTLKGGIQGNLLCEKTVGVIGTGRIGKTVLRDLKGFGCKIYAYDAYPDTSLDVEYLPLDDLFKKCDVFTLHAPLLEDTYHIINQEAIENMPKGSIIINTARGGLIDTTALIDGLESGKIGACGLDVHEDEFNMYYYDCRGTYHNNHNLSILRDMPNVVVMPHMAFYTENTVSDMVKNSLLAFVLEEQNEKNPWRIV